MAQNNDDFDQFYKEVKQVEKKDSVLTSATQIERLLRPGSLYFNLNPYAVLDIDPDATVEEMKKKFRKLSLLLHPDKNRDDSERAQQAFDALNKSWKLLEDESNRSYCYQVVEQARNKVLDFIQERKKQLAREGRTVYVDEEHDTEKFKHAVYVYTTKIFADLEVKRKSLANREADERKRQRDIEEEEKARLEAEAEWKKTFESTRDVRINSWLKFKRKLKDPNTEGGDIDNSDDEYDPHDGDGPSSSSKSTSGSNKFKHPKKMEKIKLPKSYPLSNNTVPAPPIDDANPPLPPPPKYNIVPPAPPPVTLVPCPGFILPPPPMYTANLMPPGYPLLFIPPPPNLIPTIQQPSPIIPTLPVPAMTTPDTSGQQYNSVPPPPPPSAAQIQVGNCYGVFASTLCHPENKKKKKYISTFKPPKHKMESR